MHVAFSADDRYAQHLGVTLAALLVNLRPGIEPHIHVVTDGISAQNREKIAALQEIRPFHIEYLTVSLADFAAFPLGIGHLTLATYFRLKLPALLPQLDKIIYLDTDLVIDGDLAPLWDIQLTADEWLAAAVEIHIPRDFPATIGLPPDAAYFNAGVLVMNLAALRRHDLEGRAAQFFRSYRDAIWYLDQDVLNGVCQGHWRKIDPRYNMLFNTLYHGPDLKKYAGHDPVEVLERALAAPVITHFTGAKKPWLYVCRHHLAHRYFHYLGMTPWRDYVYPDRTLANIISKHLFLFRRWRKRAFA